MFAFQLLASPVLLCPHTSWPVCSSTDTGRYVCRVTGVQLKAGKCFVSFSDACPLIDLAPFQLVLWVKITQSCPTLCDPMDCNLPDFSVHGILQARILEWVAIPFSRASSWPRSPALGAISLLSGPPGKLMGRHQRDHGAHAIFCRLRLLKHRESSGLLTLQTSDQGLDWNLGLW